MVYGWLRVGLSWGCRGVGVRVQGDRRCQDPGLGVSGRGGGVLGDHTIWGGGGSNTEHGTIHAYHVSIQGLQEPEGQKGLAQAEVYRSLVIEHCESKQLVATASLIVEAQRAAPRTCEKQIAKRPGEICSWRRVCRPR